MVCLRLSNISKTAYKLYKIMFYWSNFIIKKVYDFVKQQGKETKFLA